MEPIKEYPLSIRDISPDASAIRLTGKTPEGFDSGVHTGGAWLWQYEVWKPLDGRPYLNATCHCSTREKECLEAMKGKLLFPDNWRFESRNGRNFIVRKVAQLIPDNIPFISLQLDQVLKVEKGIYELNRAGWEVNEDLPLAIDPDTDELFLYDLSAACFLNGVGCNQADEEWRIHKLFSHTYPHLIKLRTNASHLITSIDFWENRKAGYEFVYASFNRPIDSLWATFNVKAKPIYIHNDYVDWDKQIPHTWVITAEPLDEETLYRYELTFGYEPIHHIGY